MDLRRIQGRVVFLGGMLAVLFFLLFLRAWYLQVVWGAHYRELSENNRIRVAPIIPQRGRIFDRYGTLLVHDVPSFDLYLDPEESRWEEAVDMINRLIGGNREEMKERYLSKRFALPRLPVKIKRGLTLREVAALSARRLELPGVRIEVEPRRNYVYGSVGAHLLGYVGEFVPDDQREEGIIPGSMVGQYGVEKTYDTVMRGKPGEKETEVDALGHEIRVLQVTEPVSGDDLSLTMDLRIQKVAEETMGKESGAIVALDPRTGEILAMVSRPAFNPNILSSRWEELTIDAGHPLMNRAIQGQYPPGSIFKLVVALAGLETGRVDSSHTLECQGEFPFGDRVFRDWKKGGHGSVDFYKALVESCDIYFYDLGRRLGVEMIGDFASQYGFGDLTGVGLFWEKKGLVPSPQWKKRVKREQWYPGETLPFAIGQGYVTVTPLQLATFISAIANSGTRYQPQILKEIQDTGTGEKREIPPIVRGRLKVRGEVLMTLKKALAGVVSEPTGTGRRASTPLVRIAGKTGTAQVVGRREDSDRTEATPRTERDHAWFIGYAPADDPQIAVVVIIEHGGAGSTAAPLARQIIEEHFRDDRTAPKNNT